MRNFLNKLSKKSKLALAALLTVAAFGVPAMVLAGYGPNSPDRVIYDFSNPDQREGAFDAPRFNSYINTNVYGDERAFLDAKQCAMPGDACYSEGQSGGHQDKINNVEAGKEYLVRAYVHNVANPSINGANMDGVGVAKNTRIRFEIPDGVANGFTLQSRISADNSIPQTVYDTADLANAAQAFDVEFIPGSARIFNASHPTGFALGDDVTSTQGALIGAERMNGVFPGCFPFSSFVVIRIKVTAPNLKVTKKVTTPGSTDWKESIDAKAGDTVSWLVDYDVTNATANNVTIRDALPAGAELVPGSITWFDPNRPSGEVLPDNALSAGGVNVGNYQAGSGGAIRFRTKVKGDEKSCEVKNVAYGRATDIPEVSDDAKVVIKDCQPPQPSYSCEAISVTQVGRKVTVQVSPKVAGGAEVKDYSYDFGDGSAPKISTNNPETYDYTKDGTFTIRVKVRFTVNGQVVTDDSVKCVASVTTTTPPQVQGTQTPTTLPATGPADIAGIFASITLAAAVAHKFVWARRSK